MCGELSIETSVGKKNREEIKNNTFKLSHSTSFACIYDENRQVP